MRQKSMSTLQWDVEIAVWLLAGFKYLVLWQWCSFQCVLQFQVESDHKLDKIISQGTTTFKNWQSEFKKKS